MTIANELRDQVEVFQTAEYPKFLSTLIPVFLDILQNEQPVFISSAPEQVNAQDSRSVLSVVTNSFTIEIKKYHIRNHLSITSDGSLERIRARAMQSFDENITRRKRR